MADCDLTYLQAAALLGVSDKTISQYANAGPIPATSAEWLAAIEYVRVTPGRAVIELRLPALTRQGGAYVPASYDGQVEKKVR